jgi:hypothetical protein
LIFVALGKNDAGKQYEQTDTVFFLAIKHKMKVLVNIIGSVLLMMTMSNCSKEPEQPLSPFIPLPEVIKSTFYHPAGSYWIYQELNTGFIDCVFVNSSTFDTANFIHPGNFSAIGKFEKFKLLQRSTFYGNEVEIFSEIDYLTASYQPNIPHHWITYQTKNANNVPEWASHLFTWPFQFKVAEPAFRFFGASQSLTIDTLLPTYSLNGIVYDSVYLTVTRLDLTRQAQEVHRHIGIGVGEIRRNSVNNNIDWQLLRHYRAP